MLPTHVKIVEVAPRDGLQNEKKHVPLPIKLKLIRLLADSGLSCIEATSFVSPHRLPQLSDHNELLQTLLQEAFLSSSCSEQKKDSSIDFPVLVPNQKGYENALKAGAKYISLFTGASETFTQRNINCSIQSSLERFEPIIKHALSNGIFVRGYISCVLGCPYEGKVSIQKVLELALQLESLGCNEIALGDTIGVGTAMLTEQILTAIVKRISVKKIAVHFHDTYAQALTNIFVALQLGVQTIDASVAGLGGCPYAKGASGNVSTEDLVYMLNGLNISTGVQLDKLCLAGDYISDYLKRPNASKVAQALSIK
jgi:isopropylmalate/homocitrate/citramalate synthase